MKFRLATLFALFAGLLVLSAPTARATTIRTGSGYGTPTGLTSTSSDVSQWATCLPQSFTQCDLIVQINSDAPDLGQPITITVPDLYLASVTGFLNGENGAGSLAYGLIDCANSLSGNLGPNQSGPCTAATAASEDLTGCTLSAPNSSGTFSLGSACVVAGETFYFDLTTTDQSNVVAATINSTATPEPSSLLLLGTGLLALAFVWRKRQLA
jgi:hypothetical protein